MVVEGAVLVDGVVVDGAVVDAACRWGDSAVSSTMAIVGDGNQEVVVMAGASGIIRGNDTQGVVGGAGRVGAAVTVWDASV